MRPRGTPSAAHLSGISDFEYPALGQEAIMAELEKIYPDFEKRTGWRLDSAYKEEMPADLAEEVRRRPLASLRQARAHC